MKEKKCWFSKGNGKENVDMLENLISNILKRCDSHDSRTLLNSDIYCLQDRIHF